MTLYACPNGHPIPTVFAVKCDHCDAKTTYEPASKGLGAYRRGADEAIDVVRELRAIVMRPVEMSAEQYAKRIIAAVARADALLEGR
jgi:hypothetical protein